MNIAFVVPPFFSGGRIFDEHDLIANRDDCLRSFIDLRLALNQRGVLLETADRLPVIKADAVLCLNVPHDGDSIWQTAEQNGIPVYAIALESEYIHTPNADPNLLARCECIFTYRDDIIDGIKFLPIRFAQKLRPPLYNPWTGRKFACMVAGNKASSHPDELYSRRLEVIRWYDANKPNLFDLYGECWENPIPTNLAMRMARRLPLLSSYFAPKISIYRGRISQKLNTLKGYQFCYCYENFKSPDGWITEKIFDAMFAGCIPVYWGGKNTSKHIPSKCYVDASKFSRSEALHEYLMLMSQAECFEIINSITNYLKSEDAKQFSVEAFVTTVTQRLIEKRA